MINVQKILFHETLFIIQEISKVSIKEIWKKFAEELLNSIRNHLTVINEVAESTLYGRHVILANIEILEFDSRRLMYELRYPPNGIFVDKILQTKIMKSCREIKEDIVDILKNNGVEETFKIDIRGRLMNLLETCNEIQFCAKDLDQTLNIEEKLEIYHAIKTEFKSSGMFNNIKYILFFFIIFF